MSFYLDLGIFVTVAFAVNTMRCHLTLIRVPLDTAEFSVNSMKHLTLIWVALDTVEFAANNMRCHFTLTWVLLGTVKFPVGNKYMVFY